MFKVGEMNMSLAYTYFFPFRMKNKQTNKQEIQH